MLYRHAEVLKKSGITHVVSVGRRQPMHRVHLDCLQEITRHGFTLVVVHGSVNPPDHRFYDPIQNPLTHNQLQEQMTMAIGAPVLQHALPDRGDAVLWSQDLAGLLAEHVAHTAIHYRVKKESGGNGIASLGETAAALEDVGFSIWESSNTDPADYGVHSHQLRRLDLRHMSNEESSQFANAAHIRSLAEYARKSHPEGAAYEKAGIPLTMLDLSLHRAWVEHGVRPLLKAAPPEQREEILRRELQNRHA